MADEPDDTTIREQIENDDDPEATYLVPPNSGLRYVPNYDAEGDDA